MTLYSLDRFIDGEIGSMLESLRSNYTDQRLNAALGGREEKK
jgi:hypothetical protein